MLIIYFLSGLIVHSIFSYFTMTTLKVLFDVLSCNPGFNCHLKKSTCPCGVQETKKCLSVLSTKVSGNLNPKTQKCKSYRIFWYDPKPMLPRVTSIEIKGFWFKSDAHIAIVTMPFQSICFPKLACRYS